jgi:YVTN family beta-propeller protein
VAFPLGSLCLLAAVVGGASAEDTAYLSPLALVADQQGATLYVAAHTAKQIAVVDLASGAVSKRFPLPDRPSGLCLSADGVLYVTGAEPEGRVHAMDAETGEIAFSIAVGHTPTAPVLSPDASTLYAANRFDGSISVIDLASKAEVAKIVVLREPVAAAITPDGSRLFVTHQLPAGKADADYVAAAVSVIDTASRTVAGTIRLPNGSTALHDISMAADGEYAYVTHVLARYQLPTTQLERGWINTNALSVIEVASESLVNTVLLDDVGLGAANPWGVACTPDGAYICVTHAGTHEISVIDRIGLHAKLEQAAAGELGSAEDVPNDLAFLVGLRRRLKLGGNGPRGLAVVGQTAYAAEYFSGSLAVANLDSDALYQPRSIALGEEPALTEARKGEIFFHDAVYCFQHWQSCASCHPSDGRPDGLNWDLLNDGLGTPRNVKSLLLAHQTPPAMITGIRASAEVAVRAGIRYILFAELPGEHAAAIDAYLESLQPVPSPHIENGALSPAALRGKKAFEQAYCGACHRPPLYTDKKLHDVGTGGRLDKDVKFDTPTLIEVWRTAPYLQDGSAATIENVLTTRNESNEHGGTQQLSEQEVDDLAEFVRSL